MGVFDFLFGRDVSRGWMADADLQLEFRFDDGSLCGARLGDRLDRLYSLGPADDAAAARKGLLRYYGLGLEIHSREEHITGFTLHWSWPTERDTPFDAFPGRCLLHNREVDLHREATFVEIADIFGEPDRRLDDAVGRVYFYELPPGKLTFEFDDLDLLTALHLGESAA